MASDEQPQQHELQTAWSIWEQRETGKGAYADKLFKLCTFRTVEEFWAYWNNIPKPRWVACGGGRLCGKIAVLARVVSQPAHDSFPLVAAKCSSTASRARSWRSARSSPSRSSRMASRPSGRTRRTSAAASGLSGKVSSCCACRRRRSCWWERAADDDHDGAGHAEIGAEALDEYWDKLVLGAIGETIDPGDEITGVRVIHKVRVRSCWEVDGGGTGGNRV